MIPFVENKVLYAGGLNYDLEPCKHFILKMTNELGGLEVMFPYGSKVLLKPNLVKCAIRSRNALTDPIIVEAVISLLQDIGVKVSLGDSPSFESAEAVAASNGIKAVCDRYQVPILTFRENAKALQNKDCKFKIFKEINDFDSVLNLPKLKGHSQMYFTGGVKNLYGCVAGKTKFLHHMTLGNRDYRFAEMLLEVANLVKPKLTILDGIGAMAGMGPLEGEAVQLGLLVASKCPMSLDVSVCKLLKADLEMYDIYKLLTSSQKYSDYLSYEEGWVTEKKDVSGFYFPNQKNPIRFTLKHAVKSVYKTAKERIFK